MSLRLPVLQYDEDECNDVKSTTDTVIERQVEAGTQQQPSTRPHSSSNSSKLPGAGKPAAAKARKATTKEQQLSQKDEAQSDVSSHPDVLQALAKERKRRAFIGMLKLLEHGAKDMSQLQLLVSPLSDEELLQVAQERALAGKCGNPLCNKPYEPYEMASAKYRMSAGELHLASAPLDSDCCCSKSCSSFTQQLAAQLVNPMERLKPSVLQKALQGPSHKPQLQQQGVGAQGGGVTTMKAVIEERPAYQLIHEAESAGRALDEAAAAVGGDSTAAAAVEGYIPRQAPNTHPKQQQKQQGSILADATEEVLQLQPVLNKLPKQQQQQQQQAGASNSVAQPSAAAVVSGPQQSADDLQQYLKVFREHQEQKLQQLQQKQPSAAIDSSSSSSSSSSSNQKDAHSPQQQQQQPQQQQQQPGKEQSNEQQTDRQQEGQEKQRRVRFAPDVAFTCPAEPAQHYQQQQQEQQQPVLTFTFTQGDGSSNSRGVTVGAAGGGLVGELQLTTMDGLDPDLQEAAAAEAGPATDGDSLSNQQQRQQQQEMPDAWKLFLPPALGGVGVPVKQVVEAQGSKGSHKKQQHKQHQQRQQQQGTDAITSSSRSSNGVPSSDPSGDASQAAVSAAGTSSAEAAAPGAAAASSTGSGKPRKFSPLVRPRRSVVVLDEVPGVVGVQQRGVRPGARPAAAAAADGVDGASSAAAVSEPAATAAAAAADRQTTAAQAPSAPQQQQQVASSSSATPSASSYGNTLRSSHSSNNKNQVVRIGPLRDQGSSDSTGGQRNGIPSTAQHNPESDNNSESDSEGDVSELSDISDQEQWCYEDADGSSSRAIARQQRSSSSSKLAAAGDSNTWDSDGSESEGEGLSENGGNSKDGEGSDDEGGVGLGAEGLTEQAAKEALGSLMPFFDTKGITVMLSEFGLVWNQLHAWVSPATVAYVGDRQAGTGSSSGSSSGDGGGVSSSSSSNGVAGGTAAAAAAAEQGTSSMAVIQQRIALTNLLMAAVPSVTQQLGIPVPEAQVSKHISALVRSFYMSGPLPALQVRHWQLLVTLMLGALSAWQVPVLRPVFKRGQAGGSVLSVLLQQLGSDVDRFWALMDLFELEV